MQRLAKTNDKNRRFGVNVSGHLFTQGLIQTMVLRNQWVSGFVYKKVDLVS